MTPDQKVKEYLNTAREIDREIVPETTETDFGLYMLRIVGIAKMLQLQGHNTEVGQIASVWGDTTQSTSNTTNDAQEGKEVGVRRCESDGSVMLSSPHKHKCIHCGSYWIEYTTPPICKGVNK